MTIRVAIVDDQLLIRQGIRALLELVPDLAVVAEASDGEEALEIVATVLIDVALVDVRMPRLDGLGVVSELAARAASGQRVPSAIVLTTFDDDDMLLDMVRAGAKGWLLKDVSIDVLAEAIRSVAAGGTMIRRSSQNACSAASNAPRANAERRRRSSPHASSRCCA